MTTLEQSRGRVHAGPSVRPSPPSAAPWPASPAGATTTAGGCWRCGSWPWWASTWCAQALGSDFSDNLSGGTQSAQQILQADFPAVAGSPAQVVVTTTSPLADPANRAAHRTAGRGPGAPGPRVVGHEPVRRPRGRPSSPVTGTSATSRSTSTRRPGTSRTPPSRRSSTPPSRSRHRGTGGARAARPSGWWPGPSRARARAWASWPPSSSCCWPSVRWWRWACPSSPRCSASPSPSPYWTCSPTS